MSKQLNTYQQINFICDNCQEEFRQENAYSLAPNLEQLDNYHTYCFDCAETVAKEETKKTKSKNKKNWGTAPIKETTENIQSLNLDKRTLKKTGRVHLFATRVKKEWIEQVKAIAYQERLHYNEVLEKALECYEKHRK